MLPALVFMGVFLIAAFLLATGGSGSIGADKRMAARLESTLVADVLKTNDPAEDFSRTEKFSAIPVLNRVLARLAIAPRLRLILYQANLQWTPGGVLLMTVSTWVFSSYLIYFRTGDYIVSMVLGLIPAALPMVYVLNRRASLFDKFESLLPQALDLMVSGLRGGQSLVATMALVAREVPKPVGREFQICFDEQNYGLPFRTAFDNLAARMPIPDVMIIKTAVLIQRESGGNLAEVLEKCATVIRERFRLKKEIRIKSAQGRITGWILTFMPIGLGILLFLVSPDTMSLLWTRQIGRNMLSTGAVLTLIGGLIIRKIVRIRV